MLHGCADDAVFSTHDLPPVPTLPLPLPVRVQLQTSQGGCWQATYSAAGMSANSSTQFKGKGN